MKRGVACVAVLICLSFLLIPTGAPVPVGASTMPPHPRLHDAISRGELIPPGAGGAVRLGLDGAGRTPAALTGSTNALAVVVDFSDKVKTVTASFFDTLIFAAPVGGRGSVRDYYSEVSYGTVDIVTVNLPSSIGWKRAPQTYSYYTYGNYCLGSYPHNCQKLAEDIVDAVNGIVDFSDYDNDDNGYAEPIMLIHAGPGAEFTGYTGDAWSHSWGLYNPRNYDGVTIADYVIMPEYWTSVSPSASDMTIGVFAHEMGHGFWGLPDVYDRDNSSQGVGAWSLMAGGSWNGPNSGGWGSDGSSPAWPDAWNRTQMGIVSATPITSNVTGRAIPRAYNNAPPAATVLRLRTSVLGTQEYFLLENRQQVSGSYDEYLPGNGLLVWHVDEAMNDYSKQNDYECTATPHCQCSDTYHYLLALEQADGLADLEWNNDPGDTGDPFPGSTANRAWTMVTDPESSSWYGGPTCANTCIGATNISNSSATMTADLQVSCGGPSSAWIYMPLALNHHPPLPYTPTLYDIQNLDGDGNYTVSWSTAALADYYQLQEDDSSSFASPVARYSGGSTSFAVADQPLGSWYYRVRGCNALGCGAWSGIKSTTVSPQGGWQTVVSTDFEGSFPGPWQVFDNGQYAGEYFWAKRNCRAFAGSYSGWAVGAGAQGGNLACGSYYPDDAESWMIFGPFSLEGASYAEMTFKLWLDVEYEYDYGYWGASLDGNQFYGVWATGNSGGWYDVVFDLTDVPTLGDLRGEPNVWIALVLATDESVSHPEGFYVDNILVRRYVGAEGQPSRTAAADVPVGLRLQPGSLSPFEGKTPSGGRLGPEN